MRRPAATPWKRKRRQATSLGALRLYEDLWDLLDTDYGMEPAPETRDLVARIKLGEFERLPARPGRGQPETGTKRRVIRTALKGRRPTPEPQLPVRGCAENRLALFAPSKRTASASTSCIWSRASAITSRLPGAAAGNGASSTTARPPSSRGGISAGGAVQPRRHRSIRRAPPSTWC